MSLNLKEFREIYNYKDTVIRDLGNAFKSVNMPEANRDALLRTARSALQRMLGYISRVHYVPDKNITTHKLDLCPFCGGSDIKVGELDGPLEDGITVYVRCRACGATVEGKGAHPDYETRRALATSDAVARWNKREWKR